MTTLDDLRTKLSQIPSASDLPIESPQRRIVRDARRFLNNQTEDGSRIGIDPDGIEQTMHTLNKYFPEAK